jgi:hypothetical protein
MTAPMNRSAGDAPALSEAEVRDIVAFLRTLTDEDALPAARAPCCSFQRANAHDRLPLVKHRRSQHR